MADKLTIMQSFNTKIINEIISQSAGGISPVNYLVNLFSMSKETAYRRIRNTIPFSIEEAATIAADLNLSIDQLIDLKSGYFPFNKDFNVGREPEDVYFNLLNGDIELMNKLLDAKEMKIMAVLNRIPFRLLPYPALFKFDYCHYLYSIGKISLMTRYSDIVVPLHISDLHKQSSAYFSKLSNITCVIDSMMYSNIIRKIQYYCRSEFLSDEDLHTLQAELLALLDSYERLLRTGKNSAGSESIFYYTFFNIDSNVIFIEYDKNSLLQLWIYPESPVVIKNNQQMNEVQKRWIDSEIRNSMLITKTADIQQIEILRNTYKQISELEIKKIHNS